jgi:hypothetical protein
MPLILSGPNVSIAAGARVKDAIIMEGTTVDVGIGGITPFDPAANVCLSRNTHASRIPSWASIARLGHGDGWMARRKILPIPKTNSTTLRSSVSFLTRQVAT